MANSADLDQNAFLGAVWSWSTLFAQTYLSENLGILQYVLCLDKKGTALASWIVNVFHAWQNMVALHQSSLVEQSIPCIVFFCLSVNTAHHHVWPWCVTGKYLNVCLHQNHWKANYANFLELYGNASGRNSSFFVFLFSRLQCPQLKPF